MDERALQIGEKIQSGKVQIDVAVITGSISKQPAGTDAQLLNVVWAVLIIAWLIHRDNLEFNLLRSEFVAFIIHKLELGWITYSGQCPVARTCYMFS
jgi:hypothetical protein